VNLFRWVYHHILPPNLRGQLGVGLWLSNWLSRDQHQIVSALLCHSPFSAGDVRQRAALTLTAAGTCYHTLLQFLKASDPEFFHNRRLQLQPIGSSIEHKLKNLLDEQGSDKSSKHRYHLLYSRALSDPSTVQHMLEVGIGTNNPDVVSNMSETGIPGASLRAWRDFFPSAIINGADIDTEILFKDNRIQCHHVDQLSPASLEHLRSQLHNPMDLIIDDGLHSIQANLNTLEMALRLIRPQGWIFIEDIYEPQSDFFMSLGWILHQLGIQSRLYAFDTPGMIFAISPGRELANFPV
jgi:hypothetical protein